MLASVEENCPQWQVSTHLPLHCAETSLEAHSAETCRGATPTPSIPPLPGAPARPAGRFKSPCAGRGVHTPNRCRNFRKRPPKMARPAARRRRRLGRAADRCQQQARPQSVGRNKGRDRTVNASSLISLHNRRRYGGKLVLRKGVARVKTGGAPRSGQLSAQGSSSPAGCIRAKVGSPPDSADSGSFCGGRLRGTKTRSLVKVERPVSDFESGRLLLIIDEGRF